MSISKPFYQNIGSEESTFLAAHSEGLPILLKGPTGCGKSRFVEAMAFSLDRPLVSIACNEDTSASDLIGRFLIEGGNTLWRDGPVTRAIRSGSILYLDEIAEAREDVIVVLHSLTDHRRELYIDRLNETLKADTRFQLIVSFNPGYQSGLKEMKPSTRQRFATISFQYPEESLESEIIRHESGCDPKVAIKLASVGKKIRTLTELGLRETASTRLLVYAAKLIRHGLNPRDACEAAIIQSLTDDNEIALGLRDLVALTF